MNKNSSALPRALSWPSAKLLNPANTHTITGFSGTQEQTGQNCLLASDFRIENPLVKKHTIYHKTAQFGEQAGKLKWVFRSINL